MKMVLKQQKPSDTEGVTIQGWSQGFMVGSLIIMACVTIGNMKRKVLLHKLILIELIIGMPVGTFVFVPEPAYHWYLSCTALFLYISWSLHNVIAWLKNRPFLKKRASMIYIGTVIAVQPYWVVEMTANFLYFGDKSLLFTHTRPYEALFRDPWWLFTVLNLFWNIKSKYEFGYLELIRASPRFGVLLGAMIMSIAFIIMDILSVTHVIPSRGLPDGINPFWELAYVFKCLTDTIVLDDFKTALDRLLEHRMERMGSIFSDTVMGGGFSDVVMQARDKKEDMRSSVGFAQAGSSIDESSKGGDEWNDRTELAGPFPIAFAQYGRSAV